MLLLGPGVPVSAEQLLKLLGGAASPCALAAPGLFLAERHATQPGTAGDAVLLAGLKLGHHPLLTFG